MDTRASRCAIWKLHAPPSREADINPSPKKGGYPAPHRVTFLTGLNRDFPKWRRQQASLHPTVVERFNLPGVLQYDLIAPYRPEALRGHNDFPGAYDNIPLPRQTCWQLIKAQYKAWRQSQHKEHPRRDRFFSFLKSIYMDRIVSCLALLFLMVAVGAGIVIFGYQIVEWLRTDIWHPMPLDVGIGGIRKLGSAWLGLQRIYDWVLALPLSIECVLIGFLVFWAGGVLSPYLYKRAAHSAGKQITPAQTHA